MMHHPSIMAHKKCVRKGLLAQKKTNSPTQHQGPLQCIIELVCPCYYNKLYEKVNIKEKKMYLSSQFQRIQSDASRLHYTRSEKGVNMKAARACYVGNVPCHSEHEELEKRTRT